MPWRSTNMISLRSQFILESKSKNISHSELCRSYGISRRVGYKWLERFEQEGMLGLKDRSRKPLSTTSAVPVEVVTRIVAYRQAHPSWGATKIRKIINKEFKKVPSRRAIHRILQDCNLVTTRRRRFKRKAPKRIVIKAQYCNHVWTVDFKGWWCTRDGKKVYPLTIRDEYSKIVLAVEMLLSPCLEAVKEAFIRCFQKYGLPDYIRSDNGTPFAYSQGLCGLSRLSAWWIKLGIVPNFIPPASPQYNGGHERMHRDMAKDLQSSPARNILQQQVVADAWREDFNIIRPHDALHDKTPSEVYKPSRRKYSIAEPPIEYAERISPRYVNRQGQFKYDGTRFFISKSLGLENIGLEISDSGCIDVWFADILIARLDTSTGKFQEYDLISGSLSVNTKAA